MMKIGIEMEISYAHQLSLNYSSQCNRPHGHNAQILLELVGNLDDKKMIIDFAHVKEFIKETYDHKNLNESIFPSTVENFVFVLRKQLEEKFKVKVLKLKINETKNNYCEFNAD